MQTRKRSVFERIVSGALALSLASSGLMTNVAAASATGPTPPDTTISAPASQPTSPTVVRELTEERTETSRSFLLSNGVIRGEYHSNLIHYRDAATNTMKPIDVTLQDTTVDGRPVAMNGANGFKLKLPRDLEGDEVSIETSKTSVSLRPRWKNRVGAAKVTTGAVESRSVSATDRVYPEAFVGAGLEYESRADGLKETIVLANPIKDNVFGFDLTLNGVTPRIEADRSVSLVSVSGTETLYSIPTPFMMDSSGSTVGDDYSNAVHYEITGAGPTYHLDVVADPTWLADPARVYPVRIDPSITPTSEALDGGNDTFISSKNQGTNYISHTLTWIDKNDPAADWTEYGYIQPHSALISGMATMKAAGKVVVASRLKLHVNSAYVANPGSVMGQMIDTNDIVSLPSLTWTTYAGGAATALSSHPTNTIPISTGGPYTFDVTSMVAYWQGLGLPQNRCTMRLQGMTAGVHIGFDPAENSTYPPVWEIDYAPTPTVSVTAPAGGNVTSVPTARWTYAESLGNPQAEWDLEVATSTAGAAIATAGASNTAASSAIPAPAGGWVDGTKYYVRVRVASSPSAQVPRLWSPWVTKDFTIAAPAPTVAVTSPTGGNTTSIPTAKWTYAESLGNPQDQWQLEVATSTAGASVATTSASNTATSSVLPVPVGGWVPGKAYYVRVRVASSPYTSVRWSAWATKDFTPVVPSAVSTLSVTTTASASWFAEADTNGDGVNDLKDDVADQGRGSAALSWGAVSGVTGYNVYLFDGYAYRKLASTTATSWSTAGKGIFPTDSQIASLSAGTTSNPFLQGTGRDLRDDPRALYSKTAGASMDATPSYVFRVVAYNANGESTGASAEATVTLGNRTVRLNAEPAHTDYDLREMLGHSATARLDQGTIELDATDLSIASWGPEAALSRHYSSDTTIPGTFAPGWRFGFEQNLAVSSSVATWTDASGETHRFAFVSGSWLAPTGLQATLASTGGGYRIAFPGGDKIDFDTAGRLASESDLNANTVSYVWTSNRLTIIAANGQMIDVFFNGASVDRAEYVTSGGARTVDYSYDFANEATVTLNPGTADELPVRLWYVGGRLQMLMGPATDGYSTLMDRRPIWEFEYSGAKLAGTGVGGGGWPCFPTSFEYGSNEATVCVPRDTADGSPWDQSTYIRYEWNPSGTMSRHSDARAVPDGWTGEPLPFSYWTYAYDPANRLTIELSPLLARTTRGYDSRGNLVSEVDAVGAVTTSVYDTGDRCVSRTDPLGSTTYRSYDSTGNLAAEEKVLNVAGERSRTEYVYDGFGRVISERSKIDTSTWAQTTYEDFAGNGEAQKTANVGVRLSADEGSQTLVSTRHYDEFGNLIWDKDATGRWVTKENVYSISGRLLSSEVVTGTVSRAAYNQVGQARESSTTAGGTYVNWIREGRDARGNPAGSAVVTVGGDAVSAVQFDFDPQGSALVTSDGTADANGLHKLVQAFDASGRVVRSWAVGANTFDMTAATRTTYDVEGRATATLAPGADATQTTQMSYDALGRTTEVTNPDGTWVRYEYDKAGNVVKETSSADSGPSVKTTEYDLAGRVVDAIDAVGAQTTTAYDLQGRVVGSGIVGQGGSQVAYNTFGQMISQTDVDGITTKTHYDAAGRVKKIEVAGKATVTEYDSAGRVSKVTDPDGLSIEQEYDAFSNVTKETHRRGTDILKQTTTAYDVLGRVSGTSQAVGGVRSDISYNRVSGKPLSASIRYAESTSTVQFLSADGAECGRTFATDGVLTSRAVTRDVQGRVTMVTTPGLGTRGTGYDASGKITAYTGFGFTGAGATYGYGESGQKTSESLSLSYPGASFVNSYGYTAAGRLATASVDGTMTGYHYDDAGNLDLMTRGSVDTTLTYDPGSRRLTAMGTTAFEWDQTHGRRISMRRSGESSVTYEYTDAGRLARFADSNTSTTASYTYAVGGQRDSSAVTVGSLTTTTTYVYDGLSLLNLAAQRSDGETYSITYSYDENQRAWAAAYTSSETTTPTLFHLVTTDRGDVVELTDASGQPFSTYRYDAWGRVLSAASQATESISASTAADITARQPLRYAGYCYDAESSTYYLSVRQYDPATMQFLTKDPARADGEETAYQYCGGDPVGKADPSGLFTITLWASINRKKPSLLSRHCWITILNSRSRTPIKMVGLSIPYRKMLTLSSYPYIGVTSAPEHGRSLLAETWVSISMEAEDSRITSLSSYISKHRTWHWYYNCAGFASGVFAKATGMNRLRGASPIEVHGNIRKFGNGLYRVDGQIPTTIGPYGKVFQ